jgi:hypothetical protein
MNKDFIIHHKPLDDMSQEDKDIYIDEINDYFVDFIKAAPFVEIGDREDMQSRKLRANIHEGKYSVGEIIFELQMELYRYGQRNPEQQWKLIVSPLELTPDIRSEHFCPLPGIMLKMKFEQR